MFKVLIGVVIVTILVIGTFIILDPNIGIVNSGAPVSEVDETHTLTVTIEGEVYKPSSYTLEEESTLNDLIDAAGGLKSSADERAFYTTVELVSGASYFIASIYDVNDACNNDAVNKVNINSDDAETLATINGITSSIANSIITYRNEKGLFQTLEQLQEVYGVGPATYKKVRGYVILHEWSY